MLLLKRVLVLPLLIVSFMTLAAQEKIYDPSRDALTDYKNALASAVTEHKNIFVIAGGNWCSYCHKFEKNLNKFTFNKVIERDFILMKANYGDGNYNESFFTLFPEFNTYPHILIISPDGKLLESIPVPFTKSEFESILAKYTIKRNA
ncbi:thioredoxin family protein [Vibrio parahaemolyticus]|nr:thioredoxin family protein [Vibrio parahaemolyticus]